MQPNWIRYLPPFIRAKLSSADAQKVVGNTGWLLADKLIKAGGELTIGLWMARYLGPKDFGLLSYAIAFLGLFGAVAPMGLNKIVVRDLVQQPECHGQILGTALVIRLISGIFLAAIAIGTIFYLKPGDERVHWVVLMAAIALVLQTSDIISYWFQAQMRVHPDVFARSTGYLLASGIKMSLILRQASVLAFGVLLWVEAAIRTSGLAFAYLKSGQAIQHLQFSFKRAKLLLSSSWPLVLSGIAVTIYMRIDQIMLGQMVGDEAVGIYSAAVRLSEAWYFMPVAIASSSLPMLLASKQIDSERYYRQLKNLFRTTIGATYCIVIPTSILAQPLMNLLLGQNYKSAGVVLSIHIWSGLFVSLGVVRELWMTAENLLIFSFITTASGALINMLLNYLLIPDYGAIGSAIATLVSYIFAIFIFCIAHKKTRIIARIMISVLIPIISNYP